jgi:hypothetical protein
VAIDHVIARGLLLQKLNAGSSTLKVLSSLKPDRLAVLDELENVEKPHHAGANSYHKGGYEVSSIPNQGSLGPGS